MAPDGSPGPLDEDAVAGRELGTEPVDASRPCIHWRRCCQDSWTTSPWKKLPISERTNKQALPVAQMGRISLMRALSLSRLAFSLF